MRADMLTDVMVELVRKSLGGLPIVGGPLYTAFTGEQLRLAPNGELEFVFVMPTINDCVAQRQIAREFFAWCHCPACNAFAVHWFVAVDPQVDSNGVEFTLVRTCREDRLHVWFEF